jgi:uncharacterized protein YneR
MAHSYLLIIALMVSISVIPVLAQEESDDIPLWIKVIAGAWYNDEIDDLEYKNAMEFLIETGIIQIDNPFSMSEVEESAQITSMQGMIDGLNAKVSDLETENNQLSRDNDDLLSKPATDDVLQDLESMRVQANDYHLQLNNLQIKYDLIKSELDNLKQN